MCVAPPGREQRGVQVHTDREASGEDAPEPQAGPAEAHHYGYDAAEGPGAVDSHTITLIYYPIILTQTKHFPKYTS
jgi:hypothetical protein